MTRPGVFIPNIPSTRDTLILLKGVFTMKRSLLSLLCLLFFGETGLGKTHLSLSIAGEVINAGYSVIYNSAQNIFNELQKERFGKGDADGRFEPMVLECDLLVIDDLGAEFSTQFTNAALYNIINTRINSGLPTIISTNLNIKDLEERYTRRVSSRLIGEYAVVNFIGEDVRQLRSESAG